MNYCLARGVEINRIKTGITSLLLCVGIALIFQLSNRGIDFSDEGKYLLDAKSPELYVNIVTHYGYLYHFLFSLIDFDVALYRFLNLLITFAIGTITTSFILKYLGLIQKQSSNLSLHISIISGFVSLTHFSVFWLPTPSYNSLTFQCMMICLMAMSRFFYKLDSRIIPSNLFFTSLSFALLFLAKPPAFLILILIFLLLLKINSQISYKYFLYFHALLCFWLFLFSILIYRNILGLFESVIKGIWYAQKLSATYSPKSQVSLDLPPRSTLLAFILGMSILLIFCLSSKYSRKLNQMFWFLFSITSLITVLVFQMQDWIFQTFGNSFLIIVAFIFVSFAIAKVDLSRIIHINKLFWTSLVLPFICAAGTNNNIWIQASMNFYFIYLFGLFFILHFKSDFFLDFRGYLSLVLIAVLSLSCIISITQRPYRQISPLSTNNFQINSSPQLDRIRVTKEVGLKIREMLTAMKLGGFEPGIPVIDFSGQSPTALFIAQAIPAGDSWLVGGYEGSNAYAIEKLSKMNCNELHASWLLIEIGGPKSLNHKLILSRLGLDFSLYKKVATWRTPEGAGGYEMSREQSLYKPISRIGHCSPE